MMNTQDNFPISLPLRTFQKGAQFYTSLLCVFLLQFTAIGWYVPAGFLVTPFFIVLAIAFFIQIFYLNRFLTSIDSAFFYFFCAFLISIISNLASFSATSIFLSFGFFTYFILVLSPMKNYESCRLYDMVKLSYYLQLILCLLYFILLPLGMLSELFLDAQGDQRLQGLTSEPSYFSAVVFFTWIFIRRYKANSGEPTSIRELIFEFFLLSIVVLATQSIYAAIFIIVATLSIFNGRVNGLIALIVVSMLGAGLYFLLSSEFDYAYRLSVIYSIVLSLDVDTLRLESGSGFLRVGPLLDYFKNINIFEPSFFFGHGSGQSEYYYASVFSNHFSSDVERIRLGFFPAFLYDYGIIPAVMFLNFVKRCCMGHFFLPCFVATLLLLLNCNLNTQMIWWVLSLAFLSAQKRIQETEICS